MLYNYELVGDPCHPGCSLGTLVIRAEAGVSERRDTSSATRLIYNTKAATRLSQFMCRQDMRMLNGEKTTDDWYLLWFGRTRSTSAARVLALHSTNLDTRPEAADADKDLNYAALSQRGSRPVVGVLECLLSVWLLRSLGGGRVTEGIRSGRLS